MPEQTFIHSCLVRERTFRQRYRQSFIIFPSIRESSATSEHLPSISPEADITYIKPESAISPPMLLFRLTKGSSSVFHTAAVILPPTSDRFNMLHIAQKMENNNMP